MKSLLVATLALVFSLGGLAIAQDVSELDKLRASLALDAEGLKQPILDFQAKYVQQLQGLRKKAQEDGDLDLVLAVDKEIKAVPVGGSKIPEAETSLLRLRKLYDGHLVKLEDRRTSQYRKLLRAHRVKLVQLQSKLTRDGSIEDALKVKREIASVDDQIKSGAKPGIGGPSGLVAGNTSPGELVVGGTYADTSPVVLTDEQKEGHFIRVAAGYDHWMALSADGRVSTRAGSRQEFLVDRHIKDIVDIQCGRHMHTVMRKDGTVIPLGGDVHADTVPEFEKGEVRKISLGHSKNLFLMKDGTLKVFGYVFRDGGFTFDRADLTSDVADASIGAHGVTVLKKDGTLELVSVKGEAVGGRPEGLKGEDVVALEGGLNSGVILLDKKGKIHCWNNAPPPNGIGKAVQVRAGAGLLAAQMEDGSWRIWGHESNGHARALDEQVVELGPLKDLALGYRYFVGIR